MKVACIFSLVFLQTLFSLAQTKRFLEKKDFEEKSIAGGHTQVFASLNKDNTRIAITNVAIEMDTKNVQKMRMKTTYYSKLLNLENGRIELSLAGSQLYFIEDALLLNNVESSGKWEEMTKVSTGEFFFLDLKTNNQKKLEIPAGYSFIGVQNQYILATNFQTRKSVVMEVQDNNLILKHTLDLTFIKISNDGSRIYGKKDFASPGILSYDIHTGQLIKSIKADNPILYQLLKNENFIYSDLVAKSIHITNADGSQVLNTFNDSGPFFSLNDDESEMLSVDDRGIMKFWHIASGEMLANVTDTYISSSGSAKRTSVPYKISGGAYYLVSYSTGIMSLFSSKDKKVIGNLFFDENDWAVIATDGRIDGTPGALQKLEWREYNGDKLARKTSLESTFDKYYTPRLLSILLSDESSSAAIQNIDTNIEKIPVLSLKSIGNQSFNSSPGNLSTHHSTQKNIDIHIKANSFNEEIAEVRLYHNAKLVGIRKNEDTGLYPFTVSLNSVNGDDNPIYAIASTKNGIDSEKCKILVTYKGKDQSKANLHVLIIGINKYKNPRYELNYAYPDAMAFKKQLESGNSTLFESTFIKTLYDEEVTKSSIVHAFTEIGSSIKQQDMFIFYYAGHGTMLEKNAAQEFYIVPYDVTQLYGNEEILLEKGLSAGEIKNLSMKLNAQKQIFIFDACHSASALGSAATRGAAEEIAMAQLARSTGTFWLTASGSDQFATEFAQLGHGVFTYSLLEILQGKDAGSMADGTITIRELSSYVERRVPELSEQYKGKPQYPASFSFGNDFPLMIMSKQ